MDESNIKEPLSSSNKPEASKAADVKGDIYEWMQAVVSALIACVLIFTFLVRVIDVVGHSMMPTLSDSDKVVVSNLFFTPEQGDIIILSARAFRDEPLVKRVIAVAGQAVDIDFEKGVVYVDGQALEEDYINDLTLTPIDFDGEITVPEGCVFVMGDNRNNSNDSRDDRIGCIDTRCIMGKVLFRMLPLSDMGSVY